VKKYLILALALTLSSTVSAYTLHASKQLQIPFTNQLVNSDGYEGLSASYSMTSSTQKVVCTLTGFYKGWIDYTANKAIKESEFYSGTHTVVLTSKKPSTSNSDTELHTDAVGHISIQHINKDLTADDTALASCSYMPDENPK